MKELNSIKLTSVGKTTSETRATGETIYSTPITLDDATSAQIAREAHCEGLQISDVKFRLIYFDDNIEMAPTNAQLSFSLSENGEDRGTKTIRLALAEAREFKESIENLQASPTKEHKGAER